MKPLRNYIGTPISCGYGNYLVNTTTQVLAFAFEASKNDRLSKLYFYLSAIAESPSIRVELRSGKTTAVEPSSTILETKDFSPAASGVIEIDVSPWTTTLSKGSVYWLCFSLLSGTSFQSYFSEVSGYGFYQGYIPGKLYSTDSGSTWTGYENGRSAVLIEYTGGVDESVMPILGNWSTNAITRSYAGANPNGLKVINNSEYFKLCTGCFFSARKSGSPIGESYVDLYINKVIVASKRIMDMGLVTSGGTFVTMYFDGPVIIPPYAEIIVVHRGMGGDSSNFLYMQNAMLNRTPAAFKKLAIEFAIHYYFNGSLWTDGTYYLVGGVILDNDTPIVQPLNRRQFFNAR